MTPDLWREVEALFTAVLDMPQDEQRSYIASATEQRPEVRAEVESLLRAHAESGHFLSDGTPIPSVTWAGHRIGPYRILKEIGQGGMGAVLLAEREDQYHKNVAIKIIRSGAMSSELAARFLHERQILATLEHPNIARLLDGGATDDGTPYMVMEYVDGVPINEYAKCHNLGVRERLAMFQTVCSAVHYAHQHLVVHRDIKPGNILVTSDGTPILLDFGIAKMLNPLTSAAAATHAFLQPITPEYASPEQLRGDAVTTASDVYSLGVLLYELLSGRRPFSLADATLLDAIRITNTDEPCKPSEHGDDRDRELSADLDQITLKAIRKEPEERYASAQEFAEDIGRYLAGLPVIARARSAGYVIRKWIGRHRVAFGSAVVAFLLTVAGVCAVMWEARIANSQRAKAQKRFEELHSLARSVIFELHDGIAKLAGSTEVRKTLVTRALAYLDSLAKDAGGDTNLQFELAAAYRRIGDVQGNWNEPNLGDTKGALASYRKGLDIAQSARAREPQSKRLLAQAGRLNLSIGQIYMGTGDAAQAQKYTRDGLKLFRSAPSDPLDLAAALLDMYLAMQMTDRVTARPYLDEASRVYEGQLTARPDEARDVALVHRYLATYGDSAAAIRDLTRSLELDEQRLKADPADAAAREAVSLDLMEIGHRFLDDHQPATALQYYRRALVLRQELAKADAKNVLATARLAFAHLAVARALLASGNNLGAFESASTSATMYANLSSAHPNDMQSRYFSVDAYQVIGASAVKLGRLEGACQAYHRGDELYASVVKTRAADPWLGRTRLELDKGLEHCAGR